MKHTLLLFLSLLWLSNSHAQSTKKDTDSISTGLTDYEFLTLEKGYAKMLASESYTQFYKSQQILIEKQNGLVTPNPLEDNKWMMDEVYTKKWLGANLKKTKFKSVDEAYNFMWEHADLMEKQMEENAEVYELLFKANDEQMTEVLRQETDYIRSHQ